MATPQTTAVTASVLAISESMAVILRRHLWAQSPRLRAPARRSGHHTSTMIVNCVAYQNGTKLADIGVEDISDYVLRPDCFVWVALFEPDDEELAMMAEEFGLHELAVEDACKGHQRPKIEEYGSSMFTVLQTVDVDPANPTGDFIVGEVAVFVGRNYVLSVRRKSPQGFQEVRARARQSGSRRMRSFASLPSASTTSCHT